MRKILLISLAFVFAFTLIVVLYLFALNNRFVFKNEQVVFDKWKQEYVTHSLVVDDVPIEKRLYNEVVMLADISMTENEFYEKIKDNTFLCKLYNIYSTSFSVDLLGAKTQEEFVALFK